MIGLTRCYRFPAAHVLSHPDLSPVENERIYGKCANPAGHGHDYGLEITVTGPVDPETGQLVDRDALDALVSDRILDRFGHTLLNDDAAFADLVPTAENIVAVIFEALAPAVLDQTRARLARVGLQETRKNSFEYGEL